MARKRRFWIAIAVLALAQGARAADRQAAAPPLLPSGAAEKIVSISRAAPAADLTVITQAVVIRESGPKESVERFGESYVFSPSAILVHRDEPTRLTFRNLQPDDLHDFELLDPSSATLMHVMLPPLRDTSYTLVFHKEGLFRFLCTLHQPVMSGQILVLPPRGG
jgi:plastocyanin